jgi:hypothetical protein
MEGAWCQRGTRQLAKTDLMNHASPIAAEELVRVSVSDYSNLRYDQTLSEAKAVASGLSPAANAPPIPVTSILSERANELLPEPHLVPAQ